MGGKEGERVGTVPQIALNLDLSSDLLLDLARDELGLVHAFESDDIVRLDFCPSEIDPTELSLAERTADLELRERPVVVWSRTAEP
jgi:hypothetical protein